MAPHRWRNRCDGAVRGWKTAGAEAHQHLELPELRGIEISPNEIRIGRDALIHNYGRTMLSPRNFRCWRARPAGPEESRTRIVERWEATSQCIARCRFIAALLVYEAELILVSRRGERRVPYLDFHTG